jgi:hypothetical protein
MKAVSKQATSDLKSIKKIKKKQQSERSLRKDDVNTSMTKKSITTKYENKLSKTMKNGSKILKSHKHNESNGSSINNSTLLRTTTKKLKSVLKKHNHKSMGQDLISSIKNTKGKFDF